MATPKTQKADKQNKQTTYRKISNTDPTKNPGRNPQICHNSLTNVFI